MADSDSEESGDAAVVETPEPVARFIDRAESVYHEYDEGYLDPDAALSTLGDHIAELRDTYEGENEA